MNYMTLLQILAITSYIDSHPENRERRNNEILHRGRQDCP